MVNEMLTDQDANPMSNKADRPNKGYLVEFKNGKLVFKQKPLSFAKMSETMQEIVLFREMLEQRVHRKDAPLSSFPDEFKPLIAKLAHESDKSLQGLSKYIHHELLPEQDEDDEEACKAVNRALSVGVIEKVISSICLRNNYGLDSQFPAGKVPASWHIWRWEVKDEHMDWLPKAGKDKATARLAERCQLREDVKTLFESLPLGERDTILGIKPTAKTSEKGSLDTKSSLDDICTTQGNPGEKSPSKAGSQRENKPLEDIQDCAEDPERKKGLSKLKKSLDPQKAEKEKERQEKKNAKAEKEKKEQEAQSKSRSLFANFFNKSKASTPTKVASSSKDSANGVAGPSATRNDFDRTFKPFTLKKDGELAPSPWERRCRRNTRSSGNTTTVIDDNQTVFEDIVMQGTNEDPNFGQMSGDERLREVLGKLRRIASIPSRPPQGNHLKSFHPITIRAIISQLNEAEISGDDSLVRSLLSQLRDRNVIPAKVLIFTEDSRPGYFGTWTRNSADVGPRTPFARDVVSLDYTYDSGEEWEEESGEADDVVEDAEEDDAGDDRDSDMDSWLVDDDEVEEPGTPLDERDGSPGLPPLNFPAAKRKPKDPESDKTSKRRKVVIPLVPFVKGPCWDRKSQQSDYEPFKQYSVQFFNDASTPIDPFTFVAPVADEGHSIPPPKNVPSTSSSSSTFAVPALPGRLGHSNGSHSSAPVANTPQKRAPLPPKTTFPDVHIPLLLSKIASLNTGNLTGIVETVFQELRQHKVKKNAIEAKVKEVAEKSKEKKVWVVKPDVRQVMGVS